MAKKFLFLCGVLFFSGGIIAAERVADPLPLAPYRTFAVKAMDDSERVPASEVPAGNVESHEEVQEKGAQLWRLEDLGKVKSNL